MSKPIWALTSAARRSSWGLVDENGRCRAAPSAASALTATKHRSWIRTVQAAIHEFSDRGRAGGSRASAVSATGQIDSRRGVVAGTCGNFPGWIGVDIKGTLERAFGLPVTVTNDANCMLLGEVWAGAAKGSHRCHRCDAGHRRRRRHPDRRTSAGGCARPWRRAGTFPSARAGRRGLHLRGHRLL
ncbi:MAG: ROK family protein [Subdoligranulum sp.]